MLLFVLNMVHPDMFSKVIGRVNVKPDEVNDDVKSDVVNDDVKLDALKSSDRPVVVEVDVRKQFTNKQEFSIREHILQRVHIEVNISYNEST